MADSASLSYAVPSGLAPQTILLDSDIRDWVVLPLLIIMIAAGLLRHQLGILLKGKAKPLPRVEQRSKSDLARIQRLKMASANFVSTQTWQSRREYYSDFLREEATWATKEKEENPSGGGIDPMNPMSMMDGMMGNMAFMVQNMVMMQGISHFFKGYVLVKIPFSLTRGFKEMFQRGLEGIPSLDTSYVSSVSWYFLVMYGLRAFFRLVIGEPSQEQQESMRLQAQLGSQTGPGAGPQQFDAPKVLKQEADNLEMLPSHKSNLDDVEKRLLGKRYPKKKLQVGDDLFGYGTTTSKKKKS